MDPLRDMDPHLRRLLEELIAGTSDDEIVKFGEPINPEPTTVQIEFSNREELFSAREFVADCLVEQKREFVTAAKWGARSSDGMYHADIYRLLLKLQSRLDAACEALKAKPRI